MSARPGRWVVLDVGETIIDESRMWAAWADTLGIPRMTFMSVFGSLVERGLSYPQLQDYFPSVDWGRQRAVIDERIGSFQDDDVYPDARSALVRLRERGYRTAIVANQPVRRHAELRALGIEAEVMAMSDEMGVAKPDPAFFQATIDLLGQPDPGDVAYVGDRIDNDVLPASAAGLRAVWLRRGPWGVIPRQVPAEARLVVESLDELADRVEAAWAGNRVRAMA
jgi:HAD superfamily hydrolase (TIGR01549 family)